MDTNKVSTKAIIHTHTLGVHTVGFGRLLKDWITKFENARPHIEFLRSLTADAHAAWTVYDPDMMIDLPQTSDDKGRYKIHIARSFADLTEEAMLRRAEAVYPGLSEMIQDVVRSLGERVDESAKEMAPIWGFPGNDSIELTKTGACQRP